MESPGQPLIERFLRGRGEIWRQIEQGRELPALVREMLSTTILSLAAYLAVLGVY
jgi:hypothetical protein